MRKVNKFLMLIVPVVFSSQNAMAQSFESDFLSEDYHHLAQEVIASERNRQIARQISNNITDHIAFELGGSNLFMAQSANSQNPLAASSDSNSYLPDSFWTNASWTEISDDGLSTHSDADIYQWTGGIDKRWDNLLVGLTTTYAYTETEIAGMGSQGDTHTINVTPYFAYLLTENFFVSGLTSYAYTRDEPDSIGNNDSDNHEYVSELSLNAIKGIDNWFLKGKAGFRYRHYDSQYEDPSNNDVTLDDWVYLFNAEVGYAINKNFRVFAGALYEYTDADGYVAGEDDGILYMSTGFDYVVSQDLSVGLKYSTDANNEDVDLHNVGLNLKLAL